MTCKGQDWRTAPRCEPAAVPTCAHPGCKGECFPGLARCYEHASKDALALLVEDAVRRGYRPGLLRLRQGA